MSIKKTLVSVLAGTGLVAIMSATLVPLLTNKNELTSETKVVTSPEVSLPKEEKARSVPSKLKLIKSLKLNPNRTVLLQEEIGPETERLAEEISLMKKSKEPIVILIDSPGGSVFSGEKIVSAIEASDSDVYTVCVGMCASMAAIIHQYGTKRLATDRSILMFHDAAGIVGGRVGEMLSLLGMIKRKIDKSNHYIANRSKMTYDELIRLESNNYWVDSEDAKEKGLVDDLVAVKR